MSAPAEPRETYEMSSSLREKYPKDTWWSRQSKARRIIYIAVAAVIILAIALGVGLGVGLNQGGDDEGSDNGGNSTPGTGPTTPSNSSGTPPESPSAPNGTFAVNSTWQIILLSPINLADNAKSVTPDVPVWDIDLFTNNASTIRTLKKLGRTVICYFSAGSYEDFRPDSSNFTDSDKGKELDGWPGERWLNTSSQNVRDIMVSRIKLARTKGCDAVDPDNIDGYDNKNGIGLSTDTAIDYMQFLSSEAKKLNLSIGLKNSGKIVPSVVNITDFAVNEQCEQYGECENWKPYIDAGKPVFQIEYPNGDKKSVTSFSAKLQDNHCTRSGNGEGSDGFSTVLKNMNLDGFVQYCNGAMAETSIFPTSS